MSKKKPITSKLKFSSIESDSLSTEKEMERPCFVPPYLALRHKRQYRIVKTKQMKDVIPTRQGSMYETKHKMFEEKRTPIMTPSSSFHRGILSPQLGQD